MMKNFVKLFVIDEGAVLSASTDEWSKKIQRGIQKQDIIRRQAKGELITSSKNVEIAKKISSK